MFPFGYDPFAEACPDFKEAVRKCVAVGDIDQKLAEHLKKCAKCSGIIRNLNPKAIP